ncbi:MAG: UDP-N-acetylmuramate--L-alanine ligase [Planctomycetota bacterium]
MKFSSRRVHLVGVGGAGMSGLARLLHGVGADVSGSDSGLSKIMQALVAEGLNVWTGSRPERLHGENGYVVMSAAVPRTDPELVECERRGFRPLLYAEAVARLGEGKRTLALAGCHGKTTTTAMAVAALRGAGYDPSFLIGGEIPELGGNGHGGGTELFVIEACEFNRSFLHYRPFGAAILNFDHDHFDCFPTKEDLESAFAAFLSRVHPGGTVFVHEDVPDAVRRGAREGVAVLSVGTGLFADLRAIEVVDETGRCAFTPIVQGQRLPRVQLSVSGRHNVANGLFALGMAVLVGADPEGACRGLAQFGGVRRRFEMHSGSQGGVLVNDYAHHPAEISAVLRTARHRFPGRRLLAAFQPHQHQRTWQLLPKFAESLAPADHCLVADIYGARETLEMRSRVSASDLVAAILSHGASAEATGDVKDLPRRLQSCYHPGDVVLLLGAGDIDQVLDDVVAFL